MTPCPRISWTWNYPYEPFKLRLVSLKLTNSLFLIIQSSEKLAKEVSWRTESREQVFGSIDSLSKNQLNIQLPLCAPKLRRVSLKLPNFLFIIIPKFRKICQRGEVTDWTDETSIWKYWLSLQVSIEHSTTAMSPSNWDWCVSSCQILYFLLSKVQKIWPER